MKRSTKIVTAAVLSLGLATGAYAYGKQRFGNPDARADFVVEKVTEELDLNPDQVLALTSVKEQVMQMRSQMRNNMGTKFEVITNMMMSDTFDRAAALDMVTVKTQAVNDAAPGLIASVGDFVDGLTPVQKEKIRNHIDNHRKRHEDGGRHGHRGKHWN